MGLGIEVVQNDPGRPQQNGTVEGLQRICHRWVNPRQYHSLEELQAALNHTARIQRGIYRIPAKGYATRLELYPDLLRNPRQGPLQSQFDFRRVELYLAQSVWQRIINQSGRIKFMGHLIYIGYLFARQTVTITFDPWERLWMVRSPNGELLKTYDQPIFTAEAICQHAGVPLCDTS